MNRPLLVVVSGPPGSGTSTLARLLGREIPCPVISRDEIKEGLVQTLDEYTPASGDAIAYRTLDLFFVVIRVLVEGGVSLVAEASFQHRLWEPGLAPLLDEARVRILRCHVEASVARDRIAQRAEERPARRYVHGDAGAAEPFDSFRRRHEAFEPISLPVPSLEVVTADGYDPAIDDIVRFANS